MADSHTAMWNCKCNAIHIADTIGILQKHVIGAGLIRAYTLTQEGCKRGDPHHATGTKVTWYSKPSCGQDGARNCWCDQYHQYHQYHHRYSTARYGKCAILRFSKNNYN